MTHPSDHDLDELEAALSEPDLEALDISSEQFLRAVRALRMSFRALQLQVLSMQESEIEEDESDPLDDFEQAFSRLRERLGR